MNNTIPAGVVAADAVATNGATAGVGVLVAIGLLMTSVPSHRELTIRRLVGGHLQSPVDGDELDLEALPELTDTGLKLYAGTTIVADAIGRIRHVLTKPLPSSADRVNSLGGQRLQHVMDFISDRDAIDSERPWTSQPNRITRQLSFAAIHRHRGAR